MRPVMPAGYGLAADDAGELPWSAVAHQLESARNYWLVTTRPDGRPHAMPVWGLWYADRLVFSTDPASRKGRNLAANPAAVVHLESGDDVVVLEGRVGPFDGDPGDFAARYDGKYGFRPDPDAAAQGVYTLRPSVALAWRERDFPTSATRWLLPAG